MTIATTWVLTKTQDVAVLQDVRAALGHGALIIIDIDAVGAGVLEDVQTVPKVNAGVMRGNEALRIRQHPVVARGAADIAARTVEYRGTAVSEQPAVITDYAKLQRHWRTPFQDKYTRVGRYSADGVDI